MAPRRKPKPDTETPEPSRVALDPYLSIAAAVVVRSFRDLRRLSEVELALEAFCWLAFGDGLIWLEALGFDADSEKVIQAIGGWSGRKSTFTERK